MTAPLTLALSPTGERGSGGRLGQLGYLCGSAERGSGVRGAPNGSRVTEGTRDLLRFGWKGRQRLWR